MCTTAAFCCVSTVLAAYLYHGVSSRQRLHGSPAPLRLIMGPVVGLWLHLYLQVVRAGAGRKLPVKRWQRWAAIT